jgi:serine/threonine protein phosphatase PrpC
MPKKTIPPRCGVECFGASRAQAGHPVSEDAYIIDREPVTYAAVFDGAGKPEQAARRVARFFEALIRDQPAKAGDVTVWAAWVRLMDSYLLGGSQSTFAGAAVPDLTAPRVVGAYAGNSRIYLVAQNGIKLISAENSPAQLGSGSALARPFSLELGPRDILLFMSDGAWEPFKRVSQLRKIVMAAALRHLSEVPEALLDAATPGDGPADDMTVVALRIRPLQ